MSDTALAEHHLYPRPATLDIFNSGTIPQRGLKSLGFPLCNDCLRKVCLIVRHLPNALVHPGVLRIMHPNRFGVRSLLADEIGVRPGNSQIVDPDALWVLLAARCEEDATVPSKP